jgi:hypothetical protein
MISQLHRDKEKKCKRDSLEETTPQIQILPVEKSLFDSFQ